MREPEHPQYDHTDIPPTLRSRAAMAFWMAIVFAVLAATTHGPISSIVLIMELTARDRSFMLPLLIVVVTATVVARTLDPRSIYDARWTDQEIDRQIADRRPAPT